MFSLFIDILLGIHVLVSLLIIFIVLMQRPKSEGIGAAFGGEMMSEMFANTSNVLANATRWLGGIFFFLTLVLSILYARMSTRHSLIQAAVLKAAAEATPAPAASPAAAPAMTGSAALTGTAAMTGTASESGTEAPFSGASVSLGTHGATPAGALLSPSEPLASPAPTAMASPAAATPGTPAPASTGTGH
ncbi:MAG TPA: preprotein translocase subunit SecG [Chthoniobacteraceae bacterium]|jgi:preprotein translocase subunit SecG|nr:preprotein translocase subunit SecG [Chthoniobacteraceae bacterium]